MKCSLVLSFLLVVIVGACSKSPSTNEMLVGEWAPRSAELGGQAFAVANFGGATLKLTMDRYDFAGDNGTYEISA